MPEQRLVCVKFRSTAYSLCDMLQTANWMLSYLLKAYLIKLVETDAVEKTIYYILLSLLQGQRF